MQNLQITPAAMAHIRRQLDQTQAHFLRLGVKESGCNGFMYTLDFLEQPGSDDQQIDFGDVCQGCRLHFERHPSLEWRFLEQP